MSGYAALSPALLGGPPGWVAWAVGGTLLTVGTLLIGHQVYELSRERARERVEPRAVPRVRTCERAGSQQNCEEPRRYTVRVHAQGTDCGGTTGSTIGVPALTKPVPITVGEGLALSAGTWALLNRSQKAVREVAKLRADQYIIGGPSAGGRFLQHTFPASDRRGGKRYDVDCFGSGPSFVS